MRVAFRVDASNRIGTGHVVRCLALAASLRERNAECFFIHRLHPGHWAGRIQQAGYAVEELAAPIAGLSEYCETDYTAWLGVDPAEDAQETVEILSETLVDWLVVDHYALAADWERALRPHARHIAVLDDLANRPHDCDVLVDQNRIAKPESRYDDLLSDQTLRLCGPRYALLRSEYSLARGIIMPRRGPLSRVLVFYGGTDLQNETGRALRVLSRPEFCHIAVDVVVVGNHPDRQAILDKSHKRPRTEVHGQREHLVDLMIEADLALGAGGITTWERCALGLPSIVTAVAENQIPFNRTLAEDGAVRFLGHWSEVSDEKLAHALSEYMKEPDRLSQLGRRAWRVTDALGCYRVSEGLLPSARADLQLRPARRKDKDLYFEWANDPVTRANAKNPEPIPWATHDEWFDERMINPQAHLWVMVTPDGLPVGQVRVEIGDQEAVLDYSIDPAFRGRGWGTRVLELAACAWQAMGTPYPLRGEVHTDNNVSCRAFLSAGFLELERTNGNLRQFLLPSSETVDSE